MLVISLAGGPGSGKSTTAAYLFAKLKFKGIRAELVGEAAKDLVYDESLAIKNEVLVSALQYHRLFRLAQSQCEVAISDSPLIQGLMYCDTVSYRDELCTLLRKLESEFKTLNVFVKRVKPFDVFGRLQKNEAEAKQYDQQAQKLIGEYFGDFFQTIEGSEEGAEQLYQKVIALLEQ